MAYIHDVKYYETDKMGIVHHSNYIRWFEEARIDFLRKIGFPYDKIEETGFLSPVLGVNCKYKSSNKFGDKVSIETKVAYFNGIKLVFGYEITNLNTNKVTTVGESEHCFVTEDFKPVSLKKSYKELYDGLMKYCNTDK